MYTRLVTNFDHAFQRLIKSGSHSANYRILGFVREVRVVEIGEVVIFDPVVQRATGQVIEHRLVNCARKHQPIRQTQVARDRKHPEQGQRGTQDRGQAFS